MPVERKPPTAQIVAVCVFLVLAVLAVFGQAGSFDFVNYDDQLYVYENPQVMAGLHWASVAWAFTHTACNFYHPLTMLSLMLNAQWHGLHAGGYHWTNVCIHAASSVLLFLVLRQMTGALWRSAFVAAVFAIHPLRAESVAWVAERKDVLGVFFFLLTLLAYVNYARKPSSWFRCGAVVIFFILGLLCKPLAVTLPFLLLLLDYWPLGRTKAVSWWKLIQEKIPLLVLAVAACIVTYLAEGTAVMTSSRAPLALRLSNAVISSVVYLRQMVWPANLAAFYPFPEKIAPAWELALAILLLAAISGLAWRQREKRPWLWVGCCWYVGMLVPVIGIVQVGEFAHADRDTYLPQIGLYILLTWSAAELLSRWKQGRMVLPACAGIILGALLLTARAQTAVWRDGEALWAHTIACTSFNSFAHANLAYAEAANSKEAAAIAEFQKTLAIDPNYPDASFNLGQILLRRNQWADAAAQYQNALKLQPTDTDARNNLARALALQGNIDGAIATLGRTNATTLAPDARCLDLGNDFLQKRQFAEAIVCYRQAVKLNPRSAEALASLGMALSENGAIKDAIDAWRQSLAINPDQILVENNLAWLLSTTPDKSLRDGAKAVVLAVRANQTGGEKNSVFQQTLAAAYAEEGNYALAAATARGALDVAIAQKNAALIIALQKQISLYDSGEPLREGPK